MGRPFFPWQKYVTDVGLELLPNGDWAYDEIIVLVQRRSGKTALISPVTGHRCGRPGSNDSAWITAQKRKSAVRRWAEAAWSIEQAFPPGSLRKIISNDHEKLEWPKSRREFVPFAPDAHAMHGEEPGLVWVDELWAFSLQDRDEIQAGYRPAWSVRSGQEWKLSAAGTLDSGWMKADRARGRHAVENRQDRGIAFFEWCIPEVWEGLSSRKVPDEVLLDLLLANHPRREHGLKRDFLAAEIRRDRDDAVRAYGGLDNNSVVESTPIDLGRFREAQVRVLEDGIPTDAVGLAVGVGVDAASREASVVVGWLDEVQGRAVVEVVATRPGVLWVGSFVRGLVERHDVAVVAWGPDGRDVGDELVRARTEAGEPLLRPVGERGGVLPLTLADMLTASKRFRDRIEQQEDAEPRLMLHDDRESESLLGAIRAADFRQSRAGIEWLPKAPDVPISTLLAATVGAWASGHLPAPPAARVPLVVY